MASGDVVLTNYGIFNLSGSVLNVGAAANINISTLSGALHFVPSSAGQVTIIKSEVEV